VKVQDDVPVAIVPNAKETLPAGFVIVGQLPFVIHEEMSAVAPSPVMEVVGIVTAELAQPPVVLHETVSVYVTGVLLATVVVAGVRVTVSAA
jgi:hypothetical protein